MFKIAVHGREAQGEASDHTWSINPDHSGAESQRDQLHALIKTTELLFTG